MNVKEALEFLKNHQPMPADKDLDKQTIGNYNEVRKVFLVYKEPSCVHLLLNSFGEGDGLGVYQLIEDVIKKYDEDEVIPHLKDALRSNFRSIRYWNAQIASCFSSPELLEPLVELLNECDFDIKYASLTALSYLNSDNTLNIIKEFQNKEINLELKEFAKEIIDSKLT